MFDEVYWDRIIIIDIWFIGQVKIHTRNDFMGMIPKREDVLPYNGIMFLEFIIANDHVYWCCNLVL